MCVHRADMEAECEWLYDCNNSDSASEKVKQAKLKKYRHLSSQGDSFGQFLLGYCYNWGWGVGVDKKRGAELFTSSAEQGNAYGQCWLGFCYYHGYGVSQDRTRSSELYTLSAEQGNAIGQCWLGMCYYDGTYHDGTDYTQNRDLARKWLRRAAAQGDSDAKNEMRICFNE